MNEITASEQFKTAVELNQKIIITAQAAQQNLFDMCVLLKRMRDEKLYKELGYQNFEEYCEKEVGITRRQGQKYSKIGDMYSTENGKSTSHFKNLGTEKLYLLASISESQQEEIQKTVDVEEVSVRKLKEEIAKLKSEKQEAEKYLSNQAREERQKAEQAADQLTEANKRIRELESRPITVVEDDKMAAEIEKLKKLLADAEQKLAANDTGDYELKNAKATIRELDKQLSIETQDHANEQNRIRRKYQDEINRLNEQLKKQEENVRTVEIPDMKEVFRAYYQNAINAFNAMINFISGIEGDKEFYLKKSGQLVGKLYDTLEEVK